MDKVEKKIKNIFIRGPIPYEHISESIEHHKTKTGIGAHSIFLGQIREDSINNEKVVAIEYSSYEEMANEKMNEIREEIFTKYPLTCLHVNHSLGLVSKGELCFFVFTSSAHRKAAIEACEEIVDRVKNELPIWGKELLEDKNFKWKQNK